MKRLGIYIYNELKFDKHVLEICSKTLSGKLRALAQILKLISFRKRRNLIKTFIESQLKCCPLIWILYGHSRNNRIKRLYERDMGIVHNDFQSAFEELLLKEKSFSNHHQSIQRLLTEIQKTLHKHSNIYLW